MFTKNLSQAVMLKMLGIAMAFTQSDSVLGSPIAVNTAVTALVKGASTALPHSFKSPSASTGFDRVRGSPAADGAVVGAAVFMADIKLTGSLAQQYVIGAIGGQLATTNGIMNQIVEYDAVNVPLPPGTDLDVDVYMNGTDIATTASVTVELRFSDTVSGSATIAFSRMGQATAINAGVAMQTVLNNTGAGDVGIPTDYVRLIQTGVAGAGTFSVVGACGGQVLIALPEAPMPQYLMAPSGGGTLNTTGLTQAPTTVTNWSYKLKANQTIPATVFMLYTDIGAYSAGVTFIMSKNA